jgi:phosphoserine phosphatase/predicted acylesterase/phospholipase RssA
MKLLESVGDDMIRTASVLLAAVLIAVLPSDLAASPAQRTSSSALETAPSPAGPEAYVVRLGYTTFENPEAVRHNSTLHSVKWYLDEIAAKSRQEPWKRPLQFELTLGNYYQIWSWFRSGQIDAAIVSPFVAMLLERDSQALSVLEFSEGDDPAAHYPVVAATGRWHDEPLAGVNHYLLALLDAAGKGELESDAVRSKIKELRSAFRFDLVSHLSSSGFIMPLLYVQEWLDTPARADLDEDVKGRFWRLLFENMHLTLAHGGMPADRPVSTIKFSYKRSEDGSRASNEPFGPWVPYKAGRLPLDVPSIPNDVLVVRRQIAEEAVGREGIDRTRLAEQFTSAEIQERFRAQKGNYREVRWFNPAVQGPFRQEVNRLFSHQVKNAELAYLNVRWFERGLFDFTIDETMAFLRQDQENSQVSRLAVVLSGGGVKSLYQTVLLDHLYGFGPNSPRQIRNYDEAPFKSVGPTPRNSAGALTAHTIIGTSGGAMLAFFASQAPQIGPLQPIVEATSEKQLFPNTDLPRLLSILVLLALLQFVLLVIKVFKWWDYGEPASDPDQKPGSGMVGTIGGLLIVIGAAAIVTTRSEHMETLPLTEVVFFIMTGIAVHFGITCVSVADKAAASRQVALERLALLGLAFGIQLLVISVALRYFLEPEPEALNQVNSLRLSVLASAGVFVIAAGLLSGVAAGRWGFTMQGVRNYLAALAVVILVIILTFLPLIVLTLAGLGTLLELTWLYWVALTLATVAASLGVLYFAHVSRMYPLCFIHDGVVELMRSRPGVLRTTMATTLVGVFAFCIGCWLFLVAPAVYSNVNAVKAFSEALPPDQLWTNRFRSNLVVTGTLLRKAHCSPTDTVNEGGLYFCFEGTEGCGKPGHGQWQVFRRPVPARAVDAVFASGSAFPVFPPHRAHLPNGCEVRLIDGGYAHNVPLEAAAMSDARQVLILNASPDPLDTEMQPQTGWRRFLRETRLEGGQLVRSSPDVISFMFARAQELDRNIGGGLVVASLTPRPGNGWWPFLLDFRASVRQKMIATAKRDIEQDRRIGHVLSWGRPVSLPGLQEAPQAWKFRDSDQIAQLLATPAHGRNAAFDLDNTCLRGDIGDALFLKLIVELRYHGELPEFWALVPEIRAREELQKYWRRFTAPGEPRRSYERPVDWSSDFTDYVALFLRQYQRMINQPDGARIAYPWVVQLLVGMTPEEVTSLTEDLWKTEMMRPEGDVEVRSARYGTITLDGGIRVRQEFLELIDDLQKKDWNVWIVTASNVYAARVAARALGVPADHVLGIALKSQRGSTRLTSEIVMPLTYREGKVLALRSHGVRPVLAAGDSTTDLEMLRDASVSIVVNRGNIVERDLAKSWVLRAPETFHTIRLPVQSKELIPGS